MKNDFLDLLIMFCKQKRESGLESVKQFLQDIDHEQRDNPSFVYELYQFMREPICIKSQTQKTLPEYLTCSGCGKKDETVRDLGFTKVCQECEESVELDEE